MKAVPRMLARLCLLLLAGSVCVPHWTCDVTMVGPTRASRGTYDLGWRPIFMAPPPPADVVAAMRAAPDTYFVDVRPNWGPAAVIMLFASLGALALVSLLGRIERARRDKLRSAGRCVACGYDLRATPTRCPECGRRPARGATA